MTADEQEALSRRYANDVVIILKLASGRFAVFNNARELCSIVDLEVSWPPSDWRPPKEVKAVDLTDLGLV